MSEWISVNDALPIVDVEVLTVGSHTRPWICVFDGMDWRDAGDGEWLVGISHWMPLPELPEVEDK